jgi:23S rRNA (adenine2503-C2)-methyltransferase
MRYFSEFALAELQALFQAWGAPKVHAHTILRTYYRTGGELDLSALEIGEALKAKLAEHIAPFQSRVAKRHVSADGTVKLLIELNGGGSIEAVLMCGEHPDRAAACISSQIGCAMGCDFCASTRRGLERNLSSAEIVEQFLHLKAEALRGGRRLSTLVFMGMGEPMQNLDEVIPAIRRIAGPELGEFGWRQITVSTVGIVPGIERLADADLNVNLALSLHAPDDETRARIVPMTRKFPVAEIVAATKRFYERTGRITNIEYCMLDGINDGDVHANALAALLHGFRTHVNLIPFNAIGLSLNGVEYKTPSPERVEAFTAILRNAGVTVHARRRRGDDVNAACGQLAVPS